MVTIPKEFSLVNPGKGRRKPASPRSKRRAPRSSTGQQTSKNPLFLLGAVNPRNGDTVKKAAKKQSSNKHAARKNPAKVRAMQRSFKPKARRRATNPNLAGIAAQPVEFLKFGLIALLGLVTARQVPQMALGEKNSGYMGYLANLGTTVLGAMGAQKFVGKSAAVAFGTGGGLYTANRILQEKFSPVGKMLSLSGVGDANAAASLGRIIPGNVYPPTYDAQGNLQLPQPFIEAVKRIAPPAAAAASAVSGYRGARLNGGARLAA